MSNSILDAHTVRAFLQAVNREDYLKILADFLSKSIDYLGNMNITVSQKEKADSYQAITKDTIFSISTLKGKICITARKEPSKNLGLEKGNLFSTTIL